MEKQKEGVWREVRAYDADDLETWLEQAPAVHIWLSILLGKCPGDASDLESFWEDWSEATAPPTPAQFLLSGRQETVEAIHKWLGGQQSALELKSQSREEALAVFAAAVHDLPEASRTRLLSRAVVVRSTVAWNQLASTGYSPNHGSVVLEPAAILPSGQCVTGIRL